MKHMIFTRLASPVGKLLLVAEVDVEQRELGQAGFALHGIYFADAPHAEDALLPTDAHEDRAPFTDVIHQLEAYFSGTRTTFDVSLAPRGTSFQCDVWRALKEIPYGTTKTYADIARSIGRPKAVRAVGAANGKNPFSIIVPCHRVIGKDGTLTGYAGGMANKKALLDLEARSRS